MKHLIVLALTLLCSSTMAQSWEHLTPVKNTDHLKCGFVIDDTTGYIGGWFGALLKTTDAGNTWAQMQDVTGYPINGGIWGMHFTDLSTGYIADDAGRIYKTTDASASWSQIFLNAGSHFYDTYFTSADTGFVCGEFGQIFKTTDAGATWNPITSGASVRLYDFCFTTSTTGFIAARDGNILTTTDGGDTWNTIITGNTNELGHIEFYDENLGLAVGLAGTVLRTTDGGATWTDISTGTGSRLWGIHFLNATTVLVNGLHGTTLRSFDGGLTFNIMPTPVNDDLAAIFAFDDSNVFAVGDEVVLHTNDFGANWSIRFDGVPESQLMRMVFTTTNEVHAVGRNASGGNPRSAILKSTDAGRVWTTVFQSTSSSTDITDVSFVDPTNGFASAYNTIRYTDDGSTSNWSYLNETGYFTAVHFFDINTGLVADDNGIYRSTDGGNNWTQVDNCPATNHFFFLDQDTGYAATDGGRVRKTIDGGLSWVDLPLSATFSMQTVAFANDSVGYTLGDWTAGRKTTDYGATWSPIAFNEFGRDLHFPDPAKPDSGYALTATGVVQMTVDGGNSWTIVVPRLNNMELWDFVFEGQYVYACGDHGDIFRAKLVCTPSSHTLTTAACETYTAPDGQTYTNSGQYVAVIPNVDGCDSTITINLTINNNDQATIAPTVCDSYTAPDGQVHTNTGQYTAIIPTQQGCDSTITIHLTIDNSSTNTLSETHCNSYTAPDGQVYTSSGQYMATLQNAVGCDSVITINLTINAVDTAVNDGGAILTANAAGATYQWVDCNNNYTPLVGETAQSLVVTANGNYAVIVTENGCTDTSSCYAVTDVAIASNFALPPQVFPNPTDGQLQIHLSQMYNVVNIEVVDVTGQLVVRQQYTNVRSIPFTIEGSNGLYFLKVTTHTGESAVLKVVKK